MPGKRGPNTRKDIINEILMIKKTDQSNKIKPSDIRTSLLTHHKNSVVPSERVIYDIIKKNKERLVFNSMDEPWSIDNLKKYPLPAEALPRVLDLWLYMRIEKQLAVTNRQVIWASITYKLTDRDDYLWKITNYLSWKELTEEIVGEKMDITDTTSGELVDIWTLHLITFMKDEEFDEVKRKSLLLNIRNGNETYQKAVNDSLDTLSKNSLNDNIPYFKNKHGIPKK